MRFGLLYLGLAGVFVVAVAGLVLALAGTHVFHSTPRWSNWKPTSGTTANVANQIAQHVSEEYRLSKTGGSLVGVTAEAPQVTIETHKVRVSHIAIRNAPSSMKNVQLIPTGTTWMDLFCGLGANCSIHSGKATLTRGQLVRREALEVALYTFKYVPTVTSIVAFMPPAPGAAKAPVLYLQRQHLQQELSQPLRKTLPLAKPPLPTNPDPTEKATIDKLTLPAVYNYTYQLLEDESAVLILAPLPASS